MKDDKKLPRLNLYEKRLGTSRSGPKSDNQGQTSEKGDYEL